MEEYTCEPLPVTATEETGESSPGSQGEHAHRRGGVPCRRGRRVVDLPAVDSSAAAALGPHRREPLVDGGGADDLTVARGGRGAWSIPWPGCTNGRTGSPVEVIRRTVSPYCLIDSADPDQVVCPASRGAAGSVRSRSNRSVLLLRTMSGPNASSTMPRGWLAVSSAWPSTSRRPPATRPLGRCQVATSRGTAPRASVTTTSRSRTRTTMRPSVFATSGSSTPASWVLVPVDPLLTASSAPAVAVSRRPDPSPAPARGARRPGRTSRRARPARSCGRRTTAAAPRSWRTG